MNIEVLINDTTDGIVQRLMPNISMYGESNLLSKKLEKELSWLTKEDSLDKLNAKNGHVCIVIASIAEIEECIKTINKENIYIFCTEKNANKELKIGTNVIALKLTEATSEEIKFHIKASLLLKENILSRETETPIIVPNGDAKENTRKLIENIKETNPVCIRIDDEKESKTWYESIFDGLPVRFRPRYYKLDENYENKGEYAFIVSSNKLSENITNGIVLTTSSVRPQGFAYLDMRQSRWSESTLELKRYYASTKASLSSDNFKYYSGAKKELDFKKILETIKKEQSLKKNEKPSPELIKFVEDNKTLSLVHILEEIELRVLNKLKNKTSLIKEVVYASGIKEVTMHKKIERYKKRRKVVTVS